MDELMACAWDLYEMGLGYEKTWPAKDGTERTTAIVDIKASLRALEVMGRWMGFDGSRDVAPPIAVPELREKLMSWLLNDPDARAELVKKLEGKP